MTCRSILEYVYNLSKTLDPIYIPPLPPSSHSRHPLHFSSLPPDPTETQTPVTTMRRQRSDALTAQPQSLTHHRPTPRTEPPCVGQAPRLLPLPTLGRRQAGEPWLTSQYRSSLRERLGHRRWHKLQLCRGAQLFAGGGDPMGTRYPRGWQVWVVFRPDVGGGVDEEMAMGTRNPSTRRVLPDKETGMELYFYPRVHKWATSCTHPVSGCGCGYILPIPAYPRVK
jgi:hypothetical protein